MDADDFSFLSGPIDDTAISGTEAKQFGATFTALVKEFEVRTAEPSLQDIEEEDDDDTMGAEALAAEGDGNATASPGLGAYNDAANPNPWTKSIGKAKSKRRWLAVPPDSAEARERQVNREDQAENEGDDLLAPSLPHFPQHELDSMTTAADPSHANHYQQLQDDSSADRDAPDSPRAEPLPPGRLLPTPAALPSHRND